MSLSTLEELLPALARLETPRDVFLWYVGTPTLRAVSEEDILTHARPLRGVRTPMSVRKRKVLGFLLELRSLSESFANVSSLDDLALCASCESYWDPAFGELAKALLADARANSDSSLEASLVLAIQIHEDARSRAQQLNNLLAAGDNKVFVDSPRLFDDAFLDWMAAQAKVMSAREPSVAEQVWRILEMVEFAGRIAGTIARLKDATPNKDGMYEYAQPVPTQDSAHWYFSPATHRKMQEIAVRVVGGKLGIDAAIGQVVRFVREHLVAEGTADRASVALWGQSAFLQYLVNQGDAEVVNEALKRFHAMLSDSAFDAVHPKKRATAALRYCIAASIGWSVAEDTWALDRAIEVAAEYLPTVDPDESPGIRRDLILSSARARRFLGEIHPDQLPRAVEDFRKGLGVRHVRFERVPRGRALGDIASALLLAKATNNDAVEAIYREALSLIPADESPVDRAGVLQPYAVFLSERHDGVRSTNQEHALAAVNEAIALVAAQLQGADDVNTFGRELLASLHLLQGNIIRSRMTADLGHIDRSVSSYHEGLKVLDAAARRLRGLLHLGVAFAESERLEVGTAASVAKANYDEAIEYLDGYPGPQSRALIGRAELSIRLDDLPLSSAEADLDRAHQLAERSTDAGNIARWARWKARLHLRTGKGSRSLLRAANYYFEAGAHFEQVGDVWSTLACKRDAADCLVQAFHSLQQLRLLEQARDVLRQAAAQGRTLGGRDHSLGWAWTVSGFLGGLYADLAWLEQRLGSSAETVTDNAFAAKGEELLSHGLVFGPNLSGSAQHWRQMARSLEHDLWQMAEEARPEQSLASELDLLDEASELLSEALAEADASGPAQDPASFRAHLLNATEADSELVFMDLSVGRWGTCVSVFGQRIGTSPTVITAPLSQRHLFRLLYGPQGWVTRYAAQDWNGFEQSTHSLIDNLSEFIWKPVADAIGVALPGANLLVAPGMLSAIPFHAAKIDDRLLVDVVEGLAFVPHPGMVPLPKPPVKIRKALLVLADPERNETRQLVGSIDEVVDAATTLSSAGTEVTVAASLGDRVGREVFAKRPATMPTEAFVLDTRPTPEWLLENWAGYDLVLFSGHGASWGGPEAGLLLVDSDGNPRTMALMEVLGSPMFQLAPVVLLSACESALEQPGNGDNTSIASALLRLGARCVVASQWKVEVGIARHAVGRFVGALARGLTPSRGFGATLRSLASSFDEPSRWASLCMWVGETPAQSFSED